VAAPIARDLMQKTLDLDPTGGRSRAVGEAPSGPGNARAG